MRVRPNRGDYDSSDSWLKRERASGRFYDRLTALTALILIANDRAQRMAAEPLGANLARCFRRR